MARKANKSNAKTVAKHTASKPRTHAKMANADSVSVAMKHAVAKTLATSIDHVPYDLGYSFK